MHKYTFAFLFLSITLIVCAYFNNDFPLVFFGSQKEIVPKFDESNTIINPLETINFTSGEQCAYLILSKRDIEELPVKMKKSKVFYCDDSHVLQQIKNNFLFHKSTGDMTTCESRITIYKDKKMIFSSNIALTDSIIGFQSRSFGWITPLLKNELKECFLRFQPLQKAMVFL